MQGMMLIFMMMLCCGILVKHSIKMIIQRTSSQWEVVRRVGPSQAKDMVFHWGKATGKSRVYIYIQVFILHFRFHFCLHCYRCSFLQIWKTKTGRFSPWCTKVLGSFLFKKDDLQTSELGQFLTQEKLKLH